MNALTGNVRFGGAKLEQSRRVVVDATGRETVLRAKSYEVLTLLLSRLDAVVTKDELFESVWKGAAVTEDTLVQCITDIRKAIGARGHEALKTITKVGYRLVPDASPVAVTVPPSAPTRAIHPRGIAVLPFANHSTDLDQDFLADGLAEDVITDLSRSPDLFVIARNSSFSFKGKEQNHAQIASELGVRYIVEGSLRKSGQRLRITARLIDTQSNGAQLWAERYENAYQDVFDIQDEIARHVTQAVVGKLTTSPVPRQRPVSMEVFELSLRSRDNWIRSKSQTDAEIENLSKAVSLDPAYARIHSQLALAHMWKWLLWELPGNNDLDFAKNLAGRGVALSHGDPFVRFVNAMVLLHKKQWQDASLEFDTSLAIDPNGADVFAMKAYMLAFSGNGVAGLECLKHALTLNPRPPEWYNWHFVICYNALGRFADSIETIKKFGSLRGPIRRSLVYALSASGQSSQAKEEATIYLAEDPGFRAAAWINRLPYQDLALRDRHISALVSAGLPE